MTISLVLLEFVHQGMQFDAATSVVPGGHVRAPCAHAAIGQRQRGTICQYKRVSGKPPKSGKVLVSDVSQTHNRHRIDTVCVSCVAQHLYRATTRHQLLNMKKVSGKPPKGGRAPFWQA